MTAPYSSTPSQATALNGLSSKVLQEQALNAALTPGQSLPFGSPVVTQPSVARGTPVSVAGKILLADINAAIASAVGPGVIDLGQIPPGSELLSALLTWQPHVAGVSGYYNVGLHCDMQLRADPTVAGTSIFGNLDLTVGTVAGGGTNEAPGGLAMQLPTNNFVFSPDALTAIAALAGVAPHVCLVFASTAMAPVTQDGGPLLASLTFSPPPDAVMPIGYANLIVIDTIDQCIPGFKSTLAKNLANL